MSELRAAIKQLKEKTKQFVIDKLMKKTLKSKIHETVYNFLVRDMPFKAIFTNQHEVFINVLPVFYACKKIGLKRRKKKEEERVTINNIRTAINYIISRSLPSLTSKYYSKYLMVFMQNCDFKHFEMFIKLPNADAFLKETTSGNIDNILTSYIQCKGISCAEFKKYYKMLGPKTIRVSIGQAIKDDNFCIARFLLDNTKESVLYYVASYFFYNGNGVDFEKAISKLPKYAEYRQNLNFVIMTDMINFANFPDDVQRAMEFVGDTYWRQNATRTINLGTINKKKRNSNRIKVLEEIIKNIKPLLSPRDIQHIAVGLCNNLCDLAETIDEIPEIMKYYKNEMMCYIRGFEELDNIEDILKNEDPNDPLTEVENPRLAQVFSHCYSLMVRKRAKRDLKKQIKQKLEIVTLREELWKKGLPKEIVDAVSQNIQKYIELDDEPEETRFGKKRTKRCKNTLTKE